MADGERAAAQSLKSMTGLAFLQGIAKGTLPPAPIAELMGFRLCEAEAGRVVFEGRPAACAGRLLAHGTCICLLFPL